MNKSNKSKYLAIILCVFFGYFGIHRFYVGKIKSGILYLCTFGLFGVGWIYDIIQLITDKFTDVYGKILIDLPNINSTQQNIIPNKIPTVPQNAVVNPTYSTTTSQPIKRKSTSQLDTYVFITEKGKKHHKDPYCGGMKNSKRIFLSEAERKGYVMCEKCRCYFPY